MHQRTWQVPTDVHRPGVTIPADTLVEQVPGARTIAGVSAYRVLPRGQAAHAGRVVCLRVADLLPLRRTWVCSHGVRGDRPWECPACCVLAGAFGLADQPSVEGLPRRHFYFEEAVRLWGPAAGNRFPRLAIDLWSARLAGQTWAEFCTDRAADDADALAETVDVEPAR